MLLVSQGYSLAVVRAVLCIRLLPCSTTKFGCNLIHNTAIFTAKLYLFNHFKWKQAYIYINCNTFDKIFVDQRELTMDPRSLLTTVDCRERRPMSYVSTYRSYVRVTFLAPVLISSPWFVYLYFVNIDLLQNIDSVDDNYCISCTSTLSTYLHLSVTVLVIFPYQCT
jgi:hypothetical protein